MTNPFRNSDFLSQTGPLAPSSAEHALLAAVAQGLPCRLDVARPDPADRDAPRIRAGLLAHLVTRGSPEAPVTAAGVRHLGAMIEGPLMLGLAADRSCTGHGRFAPLCGRGPSSSGRTPGLAKAR